MNITLNVVLIITSKILLREYNFHKLFLILKRELSSTVNFETLDEQKKIRYFN